MTNHHSVTLFFSGLEGREKAIIDRVIAFNVKQGMTAKVSSSAENANLLIVVDTDYPDLKPFAQSKTLIVISDSDMPDAHFTLQRPLLITRVMNTLTEAIAHANIEKDTVVTDDDQTETTETKLDKEIEDSQDTSTSSTDSNTEESPQSSQTEHIYVGEEADEEKEQSPTLHALVIDDSAAIRKQLELELRDAGIKSDFAESGEQALEKIKEAQFDLVFLDIIMPGIDGYETCKFMRETAEYKKTPIIMLSGKTSPLDEVQGVIAGATTYLTKPVKSDKLQETLNRVSKWINNFATAKDSAAV